MAAAPVFMFIVFTVGVLLGSGHESQVILLPDPDGSVGVVEVSTDAGRAVLSEAGQMTKVGGLAAAPSAPVKVSEAQIEQEFSSLFTAEPPQPDKFLLYFEQNSTQLTAESKQLLPQILDSITARQAYAIGIYGHSDRTGSDEYNLKLSLQRAEAVRDLLSERNVSLQAMDVDSHGEGNPFIPTADGVAEPRNRRVEVIVR